MTGRIHTTKNGEVLALHEIDDTHLQNIIENIERKAKKGVIIMRGGGSSPDDIWYDEDHLFGYEVLRMMRYAMYTRERERRKKALRLCKKCGLSSRCHVDKLCRPDYE